jgi:CRISPR-associated protein Cmr3
MSVTLMELTAHDPIIARDGRPFGTGQGNRMRGLAWPLPSVIAGSLRTALVKAHPDLDFAGSIPQQLMEIEVAGVFPITGQELYLPAPNDCVWNGDKGEINRAKPLRVEQGGCDFPVDGLLPVMPSDDPTKPDFKPRPVPAWWPVSKFTDWLLDADKPIKFDASFLNAAVQETRDHVCLDPDTGAAAAGQIFATGGLNVTHLPRHGVDRDDVTRRFDQRFAQITLSARVTRNDERFAHLDKLTWHPLGGERRLVHWRPSDAAQAWNHPDALKSALETATQIRMVLATPAIFDKGWKPGWLTDGVDGTPPGTGVKLRLVGVSIARWKAVSGWSLAPPRGPKRIRRMVPAGSVYFFEVKAGEAATLADQWLYSVSDHEQERRDGFGLAIWGTW